MPTRIRYTRGTDLSGSLEGAGGIGGLLARSEGSTQASYFADGNGNITSLSGGNLAVVASYRYDPYGNLLFKSGPWADTNVYRFSSKECHVKSGLYYYLYRWYSPELQRWLNRDPIEEFGGINLYQAFYNAPLLWADRDGRDPIGTVIGGVIGGLIGGNVGASVGGGLGLIGGAIGGTVVVPVGGTIAGGVGGGTTGATVGAGIGALGGTIAGGIIGGKIGDWICQARSNPNVETCDLYGPATGSTCTYWCKRSQRFVDLPGHPEGCPPSGQETHIIPGIENGRCCQ